MHDPALTPRGPREWRLSADDDRHTEASLAGRVVPLLVLGLVATACAVPLGVTFYLLAWPVIDEPNSGVPAMLGALALFAAAIAAVVLVLRAVAVLGRD